MSLFKHRITYIENSVNKLHELRTGTKCVSLVAALEIGKVYTNFISNVALRNYEASCVLAAELFFWSIRLLKMIEPKDNTVSIADVIEERLDTMCKRADTKLG